MKTVKLNAFDNPCVYGVDNKEYLVFNIDNETQTLKFQSLIGDLKVKTANILFKANSLPAKLYEMVVDDDILTFTLPSVLTGYNGSMYVYLLLNYSDDLSTSDLYTFKLVDKGSSKFNFEISSICESNISTIVSEEIKNEGVAKSILDTVSNYEFDKLQHAQQSLSLVEHAFSSTLEKRIDLFNSAYDKANATKSNTTGDINDSDIDIPSSNTDSDLKDYVENVKTQMSERLKDVTVVSQQIQDEMAQEKQSFLGSSLIFQQDLKQERDIISAYGESTRQHMDQEFNEVKDHADKVFADFSKEIPDLDASIKQVNDKIVATDNKVGTLNTKVTNVENDITELEKMHNEVTQTINNGKLISLYSNSLDFGNYDYSGNPNLMANINADSFSQGRGALSVVDDGDEVVVTLDPNNKLELYKVKSQPALIAGKTYTMSVEIMLEDDFTGDPSKIGLRYFRMPQWVPALTTPNTLTTAKGVWQKLTVTAKMTTAINNAESWYILLYNLDANNSLSGKLRLRHAKVEEGSTATPYQPNLLDAPYYLSKVPLGENLITNAKFPIITPNNPISGFDISEELIIGETYTVSLKGTKPATKEFHLYYGEANYQQSQSQYQATLRPVEGLTDVWSATFTARNTSEMTNLLRVALWQKPNSATYGTVQIDWLKIEKGDTWTPNIESYKYKGVSLRNTFDPTAFDWQEHIVADVSTLKKQVNTLTPKVDNSQLFKLTKDDGNTIKVDYMSPKPTSFLALAKNTGFYSISTAESKLMSDYNELPSLLQNTFLFINNYPPRDGFIIQEITGGEISTQLVHKYYRRIEPDGTYKNWNKVITDKDVSKMKTLYSNSTDFGNYDYSGRPNLFLNLDFSKLSNTGSAIIEPPAYVKDGGSHFVLDFSDPSANGVDRSVYIPAVGRLEKGATYIATVPIMISDDFSTDYGASPIYPYCVSANNVATRVTSLYPDNSCRGKWGFIKKTFTVPANVSDGEFTYFHVYSTRAQVGKLYIGYDIKIEKVTSTSDTATPYQPNLLDEPYYLSKVPLGENIADPKKTFPINSSSYKIYEGDMKEDLVIGQTYTITLKGTKPANSTFAVHNDDTIYFGSLKPVEGLTDVWSLTFTPTKIASNEPKKIRIFQYRPSVEGASKIDWLKIEKGETFTPNIERFEYKGISSIETSPNNYYWSAEPFNRSIYSNSVDFGKWDYTGNPNLFPNITLRDLSGEFTGMSVPTNVTESDGYFVIDVTQLTGNKGYYFLNIPRGKVGERYTYSVEAKADVNTQGIAIRPVYHNGTALAVLTSSSVGSLTTNFTRYNMTTNALTDVQVNSAIQAFQVYIVPADCVAKKIYVKYNIKLEKGVTATPYQPNLLDAPYYLSKTPLGENIANKDVQFPITTTDYLVYGKSNTENYQLNQTYTLSMKATKPSTQQFFIYVDGGINKKVTLSPVEGLPDVWKGTFTVDQNDITNGASKYLTIFQYPTATKGTVTIDWLKIEKGDTRTPNIKEYKYKGFSVKPSNNPNDYEWSIDRQYGEKRLDKMVNTTDPQSIDGTKNFLETPLVKGKEVLYGDRLFEGFYGSGTVHSNFKTKTRLGVGGLVMDDQPRLPEPFEWNSGRWQATVIRDVTFYCEGTMYIDTGANMGKYIYIANWKDEAQTQYASGNPAGMGIAADNGYWYRNLKNFSWIVTLKKGDKFSIGIELAADKEVWNIQIRTLHIKELIPPLE